MENKELYDKIEQDVGLLKQCTWAENGVRCKNKAKHQQSGSLTTLCNKHYQELNKDVGALFGIEIRRG